MLSTVLAEARKEILGKVKDPVPREFLFLISTPGPRSSAAVSEGRAPPRQAKRRTPLANSSPRPETEEKKQEEDRSESFVVLLPASGFHGGIRRGR